MSGIREGEKIKELFESIRVIYKQSAIMLADAEARLAEKGYNCIGGNQLATEQSKDRTRPGRWVTPFAALYFEEEHSSSNQVLSIGIFYTDYDRETPIEPLVIFGCFEMKTDEDGTRTKPSNWILKEAWYRVAKTRKVNEVTHIGDQHGHPNWFLRATVCAVPLETIIDIDTLASSIIDPLLEMDLAK